MDLFENLSDKQIQAVKTINEDLEIIACAGAGKTGVVQKDYKIHIPAVKEILKKNMMCWMG